MEKTTDRGGAHWGTLLVICLGFFMINLDATIVYIATPSIMRGLGVGLDQVLWVYNGYLLAYAVLLITAARLGDLFGPRRLFIVGLWIFTLASAASGFAADGSQLVAARVVQGIGASLLAPQTLTLLTAIFPPERRGAALGFWGAVVGVALVAGPTLGGFIVTSLDWRWIFFLNVPVGVAAVIAAPRVIPAVRTGVTHGLDIGGIALSTAGLFPLVFALIEGERYGWAPWIWALLAIALAFLVAFAAWESRQREPLIPLALFRDLDFSLMTWVGVAFQFTIQAIFIPLSIYAQSVLGMSAFTTGLVFAPLSLASTIVAPLAGRFADRLGAVRLVVAGLAIFAAGIGWLALVARVDTTASTLAVPLVVAGVGMGALMAPMMSVAVRGLRPQDVAAGSGVLGTTRQIGSLIGAAVIGAILQQRLAAELAARAATMGHVPVAPELANAAFVAAMRPSIAVAVAVLFLAAFTTLLLGREWQTESVACWIGRHLGRFGGACRVSRPAAELSS